MNQFQKIDSNIIRGHIETIILGFLLEKDRYGYEISNLIVEKTGGRYEIREPSLYSAIRRLETQKLISGYWGEETQGARRKYYTITAEGKTAFSAQKDEWQHAKKIIDLLIMDNGAAQCESTRFAEN